MIGTGTDQVELGLLGLRAAISYDALPESTRVDVRSRIIDTPVRTQIEAAAFVNATTARVAELNDTYHVPAKPGIHASDVIFPLLALAQAHRSSGREVIASVALAYESCLRMFEASPPIPGFDATNFVALGVAAGAAALLGLDEQQAR